MDSLWTLIGQNRVYGLSPLKTLNEISRKLLLKLCI